MKQVIHKIISLIMTIVVLFTTMSFTIDMHYCGKKLVDVSILHNTKSCGMNVAQLNSDCDQQALINKKSCCSDKQLIVEGQENLKDVNNSFTFEQEIFIASFIYSYINFFEGNVSKEVPYKDYSPPFVKRDVQVLHQTFLI